MNKLTVKMFDYDEMGDMSKLYVYHDNLIAATVTITFDAEGGCIIDVDVDFDFMYDYNPMYIASLVLPTVMQQWGSDTECLRDIFAKTPTLTVNPALYRTATDSESCNDSETKQVKCEACNAVYDSELPYSVAGDEECPECDHIQHESERDSIYPVS